MTIGRRAAVVLCCAAFASCGWSIYQTSINEIEDRYVTNTVAPITAAVSFTVLGALIILHEPTNKAGLIFLTPAFAPLTEPIYILAVGLGGESSIWASWAIWLSRWFPAVVYAPLLSLLPYLLPSGRLQDIRWRPLFLFSAGATVAWIAAFAFHYYELMTNRYTSDPVRSSLTSLLAVAFLVGVIGGLVSLVGRVSGTTGRERSQLLWILLGVAIFIISLIAVWPDMLHRNTLPGIFLFQLEGSPPLVLGLAIVLAVPVTWGIAILRHGLILLNSLLHRILVLAILALILVLAYMSIVSFVGTSTMGTAAVAVGLALCTPLLHRWLSGGLSRLVYGRRGSPGQNIANLTHRLAQAAGPDDVLDALADVISAAVSTNGVQITLYSGDRQLRQTILGADAKGNGLSLPLRFQGTTLGQARILLPAPLDPADRGLVTELCDVAAGAVAAAHRSAELQLARETLVITREQERRRIGRDLHDGLGPVLSGIGFMVDALKADLRDGPEVQALADDVRAQIREASQLIRRVARELRPTAVDQLGLAQAVHELVAQHKSVTLHIELTMDVKDAVLTPAAEVAAYAIAAEALTNVARHSSATACLLQIILNKKALTITVDDNGVGIRDKSAGLGRVSMQERAEELGGTFRAENSSLGGCRITASIPITTNLVSDPEGT